MREIRSYVSVSQLANEDGYDETRNGGGRISEGHQSTGVVRGNINVICQETAIHSCHKNITF